MVVVSSDDKVRDVRRRSGLDLRLRFLAEIVQLDKMHGLEPHISVTEARYLMTGNDCLSETVHNDFMVKEGKVSG